MEQIKYTKRICGDKEKITRFLQEQRVGTLSMCEEGGRPYAVPVNYVYWNNKVYIHGMGSGKKNDVLAVNRTVCFTVFEEFGTVADAVPAKCDTAYLSVVIFGKALPVEDLTEKTQALIQIVEKFMPQYFKTPLAAQFVDKYRSSFDDKAVAVYCIEPEDLTAKENPVDEANMFRG
ncbi:pyridoxamine 5'-phosphate oxidase family protein [Sporomusa aerivorans]|uniref:pyridoxamine 5'-phosphate oxidase family protein n=1 Tax=Sporomusa aerivorans TaxID=204936 RepID=UPI00352AEBDD